MNRSRRGAKGVRRCFPQAADFDNLSRRKTLAGSAGDAVDYRGVVVTKPWGYEYLWYANGSVAIWALFLKSQTSTSLHCHAEKRTSLIVLDGIARCSTLDDRVLLSGGGAVVFEPCVFHQSGALSEEGLVLIEVEAPDRKSDLVRLNDTFGREEQGYEGANHHSTDLGRFEYRPFAPGAEFRGWRFDVRPPEEVAGAELVVPVSKALRLNSGAVVELAEAAPWAPLAGQIAPGQTDCPLLVMSKATNDETE